MRLMDTPQIESRSNDRITFLQRTRLATEAAVYGRSIECINCSGVIDDCDSSTTKSISMNDSLLLKSLLVLRGGASSTNNAVQSAVKSILNSPSLPSPIKDLIEMICSFIESLTNWDILPLVEKKRTSKSKSKKNPKSEKTASRRKKVSIGASMEDSDDGVTNTVVAIVTRNKRNRSRRDDESNGGEMSRNVAPTASNGGETAAVIKTIPATKNSPDAASKQFLSNNLKSSNPNYRIQRELKAFLSSPPPGLSVKISGRNVRLWIVTLTMPSNTIYAGETYRLRIQFPADYPTSPPSVYFLPPTPRHEHVYTNGDICLSLLGTDWRPIMTAQSVAQAIMSILCGAQRKSLPMDNARHAGNKPGKKQNDWVYHDDNC
jgi:ubiquitin-conjugating enzyme E2 W